MARGKPQDGKTERANEEPGDAPGDERSNDARDEKITELPGSRPVAELFAGDGVDGFKRLPDPRAAERVVKGDATTRPRTDGASHDLATARAIGGAEFARLEKELSAAKDAYLYAKPGSNLGELQVAFREATERAGEAVKKLVAISEEQSRVRYYEVLQPPGNRPDYLVQTTPSKFPGIGSAGSARLRPGKVVDTLNFDVAALRRQGVRLQEVENFDAQS